MNAPRAVAGILISAAAACVPIHDLSLPAGAATSTVLILEAKERVVYAFAIDAAIGFNGTALTLPKDGVVATAFRYSAPLASMGLTAGPLVFAEPGVDGRPLPPAQGIYEATEHDGVFSAWMLVNTARSSVAALRLPLLDDAKCAEDGGCLAASAVEPSTIVCSTPCPDPVPPAMPKPPDPEAGVIFEHCPAGWTTVPSSGAADAPTVCEPLAAPFIFTCPLGQGAMLGDPSCQPIGPPCGADDFAPDVPAGAIYVRARDTVAGMGLGTRDSPFHELGEALSRTQGATIALARESFALPRTIGVGVSLWGACVAGTTLEGPAAISARVSMHNARILGGLTADAPGASILLTNAQLQGGTPALGLDGTSAQLTNVIVDGGMERALIGIGGAQLSIARAIVRSSVGTAVAAYDEGSSLQATDLIVAATSPSIAPELDGRAIDVSNGAEARLERILITSASTAGIIFGAGAHGSVADVVVRDIVPRAPNILGSAGLALSGASATVERLRVEHVHELGVVLANAATATISDVSVLDVVPDPGANVITGIGISAVSGARLTLERARVESCAGEGLELDGVATRFFGSDLQIRDTETVFLPRPDGTAAPLGIGFKVTNVAELTLARASVSGSGTDQMAVGRHLRSSMSDIRLLDTEPVARGITVCNATNARLSRVHVGAVLQGISICDSPGPFSIEDVNIESGADYGIKVADSQNITFDRVRFGDVVRAAIRCEDQGEATVRDLDIGRVYGNEAGFAAGLDVGSTARLTASRFRIGTAGEGLRIGHCADTEDSCPVLQVSEGVISGDVAVGARILVAHYDLSRILFHVRYECAVKFGGE